MSHPLIEVNLEKLKDNARLIVAKCHEAGIKLALVTKVVCADPVIIEALQGLGVDLWADARLHNLNRLDVYEPKMMLRVGDPAQAMDLVEGAHISLQSEIATIKALGKAAGQRQQRHQIVLMIDLGDLREGIFFKDEKRLFETVETVLSYPALDLVGLGCNLTCFGGIIPDSENMGQLTRLAQLVRDKYSLPMPLISGGNSSSLGLLFRGEMPQGITNLRIGEGLFLGRDTAIGAPLPPLHQDVFTIKATLVEVADKPSKPIGSTGPNAFGEEVSFPDLGPMRRGIVAIGRQDTVPDSLTPLDDNIAILGASSDHLLLDLTKAKDYQVGDVLSFRPGYGALLSAFTSPYVTKRYVEGV